ncbi:Pex19 family protein [Helicosporidium sp. ATCC 50920]|nr:Pex19 family protein [Helicosporidium sp. ATCC 50920]|eukprot:KDD76935.1 Pex19 family protein [Helicosporidium sp. ATCC 50920]
MARLFKDIAAAEDAEITSIEARETREASGSFRATTSASEKQAREQLGATLQALAEQTPQFERPSQGAEEGIPELGGLSAELLERLAAQLGGLESEDLDLSELAEGLGAGDGEGSPGGLVDALMQQLLAKEVLYQPMREIGERYPAWLAAHEQELDPEELQRYRSQQACIAQICALYEREPHDFAELMELLQKMQACGQPPQDIVDELAPGLAFGADGLPAMGGEGPGDKGCPVQ